MILKIYRLNELSHFWILGKMYMQMRVDMKSARFYKIHLQYTTYRGGSDYEETVHSPEWQCI